MTKGRETEIMTMAVAIYGKGQLVKAMEEMAEAIQAVSKVYLETESTSAKDRIAHRIHLAEELADVEIMTEQVKLLMPDVADAVNAYREYKLGRLRDRIEDTGRDSGRPDSGPAGGSTPPPCETAP